MSDDFMGPLIVDDFIGPFIALSKASIDASRSAVRYEAQVCRIAEKLTWLIARTNQWASIFGSPRDGEYQRFKSVLKQIHICMQHASKEKSEKWIALTYRLNPFKKYRINPLNPFKKDRIKLIQELEDAEQQLNYLISDFHLEQMNMQMLQMLRMEKEIATTIDSALNRFGSIINDTSLKTIQQEFDETLDMCIQQVAVVSSVDRDFLTDDSLIIDKEKLHFDENDSYLGGGGFADVYLGKYKGHDVAVKRLKLDPKAVERMDIKELKADQERIKREALLTYEVSSHSNIVNIYGYHTNINKVERPLIMMELMHTTLFEAIHYRKETLLSFSQIFHLMMGIAQAIEFLHLQGIIHHDIKSSNILLDSTLSQAKLSDFGEAKVEGLETTRRVQSEMLSTRGGDRHAVAGTIAYMAPEILTKRRTGSFRSSDMYSFGATLWECLTGKIPHEGENDSNIKSRAYKEEKPMLIIPSSPSLDLSDQEKQAWMAIQDMTTQCVSRDFKSRPTVSVVVRNWRESKIMPPSPIECDRPLQPDLKETPSCPPTMKTTGSIQYDVKHLFKAGMVAEARQILVNVGWILDVIQIKHPNNIANDYQLLEKNDGAIQLIGHSIRMSSNAIEEHDWKQLPSQIIGRLYSSIFERSINDPIQNELLDFIKRFMDFNYNFSWWCPIRPTWEQAEDVCRDVHEDVIEDVVSNNFFVSPNQINWKDLISQERLDSKVGDVEFVWFHYDDEMIIVARLEKKLNDNQRKIHHVKFWDPNNGKYLGEYDVDISDIQSLKDDSTFHPNAKTAMYKRKSNRKLKFLKRKDDSIVCNNESYTDDVDDVVPVYNFNKYWSANGIYAIGCMNDDLDLKNPYFFLFMDQIVKFTEYFGEVVFIEEEKLNSETFIELTINGYVKYNELEKECTPNHINNQQGTNNQDDVDDIQRIRGGGGIVSLEEAKVDDDSHEEKHSEDDESGDQRNESDVANVHPKVIYLFEKSEPNLNQIRVQDQLTGKNLDFCSSEVLADDKTVGSLKDDINTRYELLCKFSEFFLVFNNKTLEDDKTLGQQEVNGGDTIILKRLGVDYIKGVKLEEIQLKDKTIKAYKAECKLEQKKHLCDVTLKTFKTKILFDKENEKLHVQLLNLNLKLDGTKNENDGIRFLGYQNVFVEKALRQGNEGLSYERTDYPNGITCLSKQDVIDTDRSEGSLGLKKILSLIYKQSSERCEKYVEEIEHVPNQVWAPAKGMDGWYLERRLWKKIKRNQNFKPNEKNTKIPYLWLLMETQLMDEWCLQDREEIATRPTMIYSAIGAETEEEISIDVSVKMNVVGMRIQKWKRYLPVCKCVRVVVYNIHAIAQYPLKNWTELEPVETSHENSYIFRKNIYQYFIILLLGSSMVFLIHTDWLIENSSY